MEEYLTVLDVSRHQGEIDFNITKSRGVSGVAIRATVGDFYTDPRFYINWDRAGEAGLRRTAYHVTRPMSSVKGQMERFKAVVGDRRPSFGKVGWVSDNECTDNAEVQKINDLIWYSQNFLADHAGVTSLNYTRAEWFNRCVRRSVNWKKFPLWVARYINTDWPWLVTAPNSIYKPLDYDDWALWQWSADGNKMGRYYGVLPDPGAPEPSIDINRARKWLFVDAPVQPPAQPPAQPPSEALYIINVDWAYVRSTPNGKALSVLSKGMPVTVLQEGDWAKVRLPGYEAYIAKSLLKKV